MRYLPYSTYNSEYISKGQKAKVFFNPDNAVAVFEEEDTEIWDWVIKNSPKLKQNNFYLNKANEAKIRSEIKGNKATQATQPETKEVAGINFDKEEFLSRLESATSLKQVKVVISEFVKNL